MGARKGNQNRRGVPQWRTLEVMEMLEQMNCNPIEGMARIALIAEYGFKDQVERLAKGEEGITIQGCFKDLNLAGAMYKELAQYVAPKRKAIEMNVSSSEIPILDTKLMAAKIAGLLAVSTYDEPT
jgi:hypothetical protein